jgi:transposase
MGKIKTVEPSKAQRAALEKGYRAGSSYAFRPRCQMILLRNERRTAAEIADLPGCCEVVGDNWLKRYEVEGIEGLCARPGRGRKPVLDAEQDLPSINCFALLSRASELLSATTRQRITSSFIVERFERLSFSIRKPTVLVLDNARAHKSRQAQERCPFWQARGLHIFHLLSYSPHLNIAEALWRKLKYEWLQPADYTTVEGLSYS